MIKPSENKLCGSCWIFLISLFCFTSCHRDVEYPYETVAMTLSNADNSGEEPVPAGDSVSKYAYAIQMNLTLEPRYDQIGDPYESVFENEDEVSSFSVTCSQPFNGIAPNESLNHLFNNEGYQELAPPYNGLFSGSAPGASEPDSWPSTNYLLLMVPPVSEGTYTFHVSGTFSDGRVLSDSVTVKLYE